MGGDQQPPLFFDAETDSYVELLLSENVVADKGAELLLFENVETDSDVNNNFTADMEADIRYITNTLSLFILTRCL